MGTAGPAGPRIRWILLLVLAYPLAACTSSAPSAPTLPIKGQGATYAAVASGLQCTPHGQSVTITGTLTGAANVPAYSGVAGYVFDGSGMQIGSADGPILTLNHGQSQSFTITVSVTDTPASCVVGWGAGPPPGA